MSAAVKDTRPPPPSWLDKDFIQTALRAGAGNSGITVLSCEVRMANAVGDGYSSDMYRVKAELEGYEQRCVIVKCQPQGGMREQIAKNIGAFEREVNMLTKTLPKMHQILEKSAPGQFQPFAANCVYHGNEPTPFIVLEDLKQSGFTLAKRQRGVDLAHCSLAIKTVARFHATSLALLDQDPTALQYYDESVFSGSFREQCTKLFENSVCALGSEVANWPGYEKYTEKLKICNKSLVDKFIQICKRKENAFNVLTHSDLWTNNMMFKYSNTEVTDIKLVDFQLCHYSSPALDLQYFLYTVPSEEVRINHLDNLLQEYHSTLTEILNILGCTKYKISLAELKKDFEDHVFYGFTTTISLLPIVYSNPEDSFDAEVILSSNGEATEGTKNIMANEMYVKTMKRLLPFFESKGVI